MRRTSSGTGRQLGLFLEGEARHQPAEETHEALIQTLADLLLEAYGEETHDEPKFVVRELRPQVVHTHGYRADVQAGAVARRLVIPASSTVHGFT